MHYKPLRPLKNNMSTKKGFSEVASKFPPPDPRYSD